MAYISKAERDKIPAEDYGIPEKKLYPIRNQKDLDDAEHLIGKHPEAKARIIAIAKRKKLVIPQEWDGENMNQTQKPVTHAKTLVDGLNGPDLTNDRSRMTANFALAEKAFRVEGDFAVYDNAMLFEAGSYPDKRFEISPEEMAAAAESFKPVGGNIEHTDFLKGKACEVRKVFVDDEDPWKLRGQVAVPLWLNSALGDHEKKLSCEWNPKNKTLDGLALCVHPAIPEARLFAAFAEEAQRAMPDATFADTEEHRTPHGQSRLQEIHDIAARSGAICDPDPDNKNAAFKNAAFISKPEHKAFQKIHDHAVMRGAKCPGGGYNPYFTRPSKPKVKPMQKTFLGRLAAHAGFKNDAGQSVLEDPDVAAIFTDLAEKPAESKPEEPQVIKYSETAEFKAQQAEIDRLKAVNLGNEALAWANSVIDAKKALPNERDTMVTLYTAAASDDARSGTANFSVGGKTSRVELLKANFDARPAHMLFDEKLADVNKKVKAGEFVLVSPAASDAKDSGPSAEDVADLRKFSTILKQNDKANPQTALLQQILEAVAKPAV